MSAIILDQTIVHYEALGRGRPIVFLHSWVGSWRYWIAAMQVASTSFRAYALDLFGYGDTAHDSSQYSLAQQASLVTRFLDEMGIGKIAIVGHGLGALVGFQFAAQRPGSVDRIMAINLPLDFNSINIGDLFMLVFLFHLHQNTIYINTCCKFNFIFRNEIIRKCLPQLRAFQT